MAAPAHVWHAGVRAGIATHLVAHPDGASGLQLVVQGRHVQPPGLAAHAKLREALQRSAGGGERRLVQGWAAANVAHGAEGSGKDPLERG
jgi:hypothetical protein